MMCYPYQNEHDDNNDLYRRLMLTPRWMNCRRRGRRRFRRRIPHSFRPRPRPPRRRRVV